MSALIADTIKYPTGEPLEGATLTARVRVDVNDPLAPAFDPTILWPSISDTSEADGTVTLELIGNDDIDPPGSYYEFEVSRSGIVLTSVKKTVPITGGPFKLSDLTDFVPVIPGTGGWISYGTTEGIPILDAKTTTPTLGAGTQEARYCMIGRMVVGYFNYLWGAGGAAGLGNYSILIPMPPRQPLTGQGRTIGTVNAAGDAPFAIKNQQNMGLAWNPEPSAFPAHPADRTALILPHRYFYTDERATAIVPSGQNHIDVTTGFPVQPGTVQVTPAGDWATGGMARYWITYPSAGVFRINAVTSGGGNLTANQAFNWFAPGPIAGDSELNGLFVTDQYPWPMGITGIGFDGAFMYDAA
jgi:hypothetical protein